MMTRLNPITTPRHELRAEQARRTRKAASDDHFNRHPNEVGCEMAGNFEHCASLLKRATDSASGAGEPAE